MKTSLLTTLLFLSFFCNAQMVTINPTIRPTDIVLLNDNTATVLGDDLSPHSSMDAATNVFLQKYNINTGAKLWEKKITESRGLKEEEQFLIQTSDNGYLLVTCQFSPGQNGWEKKLRLVKTDENGTVQWRSETGPGLTAYDLIETKDGNYVVTGTLKQPGDTSGNKIFIQKTSNGVGLWGAQISATKPASGTGQLQAHKIIEASDSGFIIVGYIMISDAIAPAKADKDIFIVKTDNAGNELWRKSIDYNGGDDIAWTVAEAANGDYVVGGAANVDDQEMYAARLSATGTVLWSRIFENGNGHDAIKFVQLREDGIIKLLGDKRDHNGFIYPHLIKLKGTGEIESEETKRDGSPDFHNYDLTAFQLSGTSSQDVVVGKSWLLRIFKTSNSSCNLAAAITSDKALPLCPNQSVILDAGAGFSSYKWSTGATTRTITVSAAGVFNVEVADAAGCRYTTPDFEVAIHQPYQGESICYVTVDSTTAKNRIIWKMTPDQHIAAYNVYKDAVGGPVKIGSVPFGAAANLADTNSQPDIKTERYTIKAVDGCGNESEQSAFHRTILLQASLGTSGEVNLTWNRYQGAPAVKTIIYRGRNNSTLAPITELTGQEDRYIDRSPVSEEKIYRIGIELDADCDAGISGGRLASPTAQVLVLSNTLSLQVNGLADDYKTGSKLISVWPNPTGRDATITIEQDQPQPVKLQILNATGQLVRQQAVPGYTITLERNRLPAGLYVVAVTLKNGKMLKEKVILK